MIPKAPLGKKRRILESARRLLVRRGFQDIVLDDVAREAGVAKGTLFLYYKDKDELLTAAFGDLVDRLGETIDGVQDRGLKGRALLTELVRAILEHFERNLDFMSQFGAGRFPGCRQSSSGRLMEKMSLNLRRVERVLEACAQDGLVRLKDKEYAAVSLFGLCRSALNAKLFRGAKVSLSEDTEKVLEFFLFGARGAR